VGVPVTPLLDVGLLDELARVEVAPGDSFLPHFLQSFSRDASATLERMRAQARSGDTSEVARQSHLLKGTAASIGAPRLAEALAEIEADAATMPAEVLDARIQNAIGLLNRSAQAIVRYCHVAKLRGGLPPSVEGCDGAT
jgi:HPt (histidine-containing phosphotransfer) domain-containing protein